MRLLLLGLTIALASPASGQTALGPRNPVPDLQTVVNEHRPVYQTYKAIVLADTQLTIEEKEARLLSRQASIREEVRNEREAAYKAFRYLVAAQNSATGRGARSDGKCAGPPSGELEVDPGSIRNYITTRLDWDTFIQQALNGQGEQLGVGAQVRSDGAICTHALRQSGSGFKRTVTLAEYRYRGPEQRAQADAELVIQQII